MSTSVTKTFEQLTAGDRFFAGSTLWTKLDRDTARRHSDESVALGQSGHGYIGDALCSFQDKDEVRFVPPTPTIVTQQEVGGFVDSLVLPTGIQRQPGPIAGRLTEEAVELCLSAGLTAGQILEHVMNSLHNQAVKASARAGRTIFPSQLAADPEGIGGEAGDVGILLKDLCHVAGVDLIAAERSKLTKFTSVALRVAPNGTVYRVKPHVKE